MAPTSPQGWVHGVSRHPTPAHPTRDTSEPTNPPLLLPLLLLLLLLLLQANQAPAAGAPTPTPLR